MSSLIGLQGEDKYAFRDFPGKQTALFKEQEESIETEIKKALKQYGFHVESQKHKCLNNLNANWLKKSSY